MFNKIPQYVKEVLNTITQFGHEAYIVGGCVRDIMLGRTPYDYDITTSATPDELLDIFKNHRVITTGLKHGTLTVIKDGGNAEVTTYRIDGEYTDSRHPSSVAFTRSLQEDLARRDFTVNAMAWSQSSGLIDIFGGSDDLKSRLIRCVGDPEKRFSEDALRILRCVRFASTLDFKIDADTALAASRLKSSLKNISAERKAVELKKLICGAGCTRVIRENLNVISEIIPELALQKDFDQRTKYHNRTLLDHTLSVMDHLPQDNVALRFSALLHDSGKPAMQTFDKKGVAHYKLHPIKSAEIADRVMSELRFDKKTHSFVLCIIKWHDTPIEYSRPAVKKVLHKLGKETFFDLIRFKIADNKAQSPNFDRSSEYSKLVQMAEDIINSGECYTLDKLDIDGSCLIEHGIAYGANIGKTLDTLLTLVIDGKIENKKELLIKAALEINSDN
jgi:tRNA nucleotidyltransferase (CCA-adding enzyme)